MAWTLRATPSRCGFHPLAVRRFAPAIQRIHLTAPVHDPFGLIPGLAGDPQRVRQDNGGILMKLRTHIKISSILIAMVMAGCATQTNHTGFLIDRPDSNPAARSYSGSRPPIPES